jgi:predicted porin
MKKTIIAAAVAASVAAPAAFADVSISGMVNPEFTDRDSDNGWGDSAVNADLVFKGSEDLGNGLTASFKYHIFHDGDSTTSGIDGSTGGKTADTSVSIKGDFGTVIAGRMESFHESVSQAFTNIDASHDLDLENGLAVHNFGDRVNSALAYVSPTVNGFHVGVASIQGLAGDDVDSFNSATDIIAVYENAGLKVFANRLSADGSTLAGTEDASATAYGASYKMGDLEVRAMKRSIEVDNSDDQDSTFFGAKYNMGAITLAAGNVDDDTNGDSTIYSVSYALSKRTSVYLADVDHDNDNADGTDVSATTVGVKHTF